MDNTFIITMRRSADINETICKEVHIILSFIYLFLYIVLPDQLGDSRKSV